MLGNGFDIGTAALIMGPAGSGKSTVVMQTACSAAAIGIKTAMYLFDERPHTQLVRAEALSLDFKKYVDAGLIMVQQIDPAELSPGEFYNLVQQAVEHEDVKLVAIDSLSGFLNAMPTERFLVLQLHELMSYLAQKGANAFLVLGQSITRDGYEAPLDISYLADTVIQTRYFLRDGETHTAVMIYKRRTGAHDRGIWELQYGPGGLRVERSEALTLAAAAGNDLSTEQPVGGGR
jgi:circadian clock protein KaiC